MPVTNSEEETGYLLGVLAIHAISVTNSEEETGYLLGVPATRSLMPMHVVGGGWPPNIPSQHPVPWGMGLLLLFLFGLLFVFMFVFS